MQEEILKIANEARTDAKSAMMLATEANHKIDSYMKVQTIQQAAILEKIEDTKELMREVQSSVKSLYNRAWVVAGALIITLLGTLGWTTTYIIQYLQRAP